MATTTPSRARTAATLRYGFDDLNRLVVSARDRATGRWRPVRILDGRVTVGPGNQLLYQVERTVRAEAGREAIPEAVLLDGTWRLTPAHQLALTLHETGRQERTTLYLKGAIVQAEANALTLALHRTEGGDLAAAQRLALLGRWSADPRNRLSFLVEKADGSEDRLVLQGGWQVGPHHEMLYRYRQVQPGGSGTDEHILSFEGAWEVTRADRLVYRLSGSSNSAFEFRAALQSPALQAGEGRIVYQVGIGLSAGKTQQQRVALFGTWKLNRDLSVSFEIPYADGRVQAIRFEGAASLTARDRIAVALSPSRRDPLGLTVIFTRQLVPDANLFLRLQKSAEEQSVIGGVQVRF